jgi:hypothetical protein
MADKLTRRALIASAGVAAAGTGLGIWLGTRGEEPEEPQLSSLLTAGFFDGVIPVDDHGHFAWRNQQGVLVAMLPQQAAPPYLEEAGLSQIELRALHNSHELAFLLEWDDPDQDDLDGILRFHDACAVALPWSQVEAPPPITMGAPGNPLQIFQWRASWQRDVDGGRTGPEALYPNLVRDTSPDELLGPTPGAPYEPARAVGNPLSQRRTGTPIEEVISEGFGTTTGLTEAGARGRGIFTDGRWSVVISFPLARPHGAAPIEPGSSWPVSFAVWLGSMGNRGGRKHYADWVSCTLEAAA